jgi:hypothetical protein
MILDMAGANDQKPKKLDEVLDSKRQLSVQTMITQLQSESVEVGKAKQIL